jgi:hypothetical protein
MALSRLEAGSRYTLHSLPLFFRHGKELFMRTLPRNPGIWLESAGSGRRPRPAAVLLVLLAGMLMIIYLTPGAISAESPQAIREKGTNPMQASATASLNTLPSLDVTQPSRVETFTFGLG